MCRASRDHGWEEAWFCETARCDVAYFDQFERFVPVGQLQASVYPKDAAAPICACFGFTADDIEADCASRSPDTYPRATRQIQIRRCALPDPRGRRSMLHARSAARLSEAPGRTQRLIRESPPVDALRLTCSSLSLFSFRFSAGVRCAFFCCSLLPLSLLPLSPTTVSPVMENECCFRLGQASLTFSAHGPLGPRPSL